MDLSEPERTSMRRYERWLRVNDPVEPPAASRRPPPGASVLLAVDQELGQGATLRVAQDRPASSPLVSAVVPVRAPGCRRPPRCVGERPLDWPAAGSRTPSSRRGCYVQYPRAVGMPPPPNATIATPTMMARRACLTPEESSEAAAWSTTMAGLRARRPDRASREIQPLAMPNRMGGRLAIGLPQHTDQPPRVLTREGREQEPRGGSAHRGFLKIL
jgi:hypothetical protein